MTHYENEKEDLLSYFEQMLFDEPERSVIDEPKRQELTKRYLMPSDKYVANKCAEPNQSVRKFLSAKKNHPRSQSVALTDDGANTAFKENFEDKPEACADESFVTGFEKHRDESTTLQVLGADKIIAPSEKSQGLNLARKLSDNAKAINKDRICNTDELNLSFAHEAVADEDLADIARTSKSYILEPEPNFEVNVKNKQTLLCTPPSIASLLEALNTSTDTDEAVATANKTSAAITLEKTATADTKDEVADVATESACAFEDALVAKTLPSHTDICGQSAEISCQNADIKPECGLSESTAAEPIKEALPESLCWSNIDLEDEFQVLFFLVKGVRFAVPLIELGGIYEIGPLTKIAKHPRWYLGLSDMRGEKISVVDTLSYVKPGDTQQHSYQYMIVLNNSKWALGCDVLEGNRIIEKSQVKFRLKAGSRPYLAGIVKKEMCALLHVPALVTMLNQGLALDALSHEQN